MHDSVTPLRGQGDAVRDEGGAKGGAPALSREGGFLIKPVTVYTVSIKNMHGRP